MKSSPENILREELAFLGRINNVKAVIRGFSPNGDEVYYFVSDKLLDNGFTSRLLEYQNELTNKGYNCRLSKLNGDFRRGNHINGHNFLDELVWEGKD